MGSCFQDEKERSFIIKSKIPTVQNQNQNQNNNQIINKKSIEIYEPTNEKPDIQKNIKENNINKLDFNENISDTKEEQEKINSVALRMKIDSQNNLDLQIKKDSKNLVLNSKFDINLKITIKKVIHKDDFKASVYIFENDGEAPRKLVGESEKRAIKENQVVTFNSDFIVNYDFIKIQPLQFTITKNIQTENLNINLADILNKPYQIYYHNFPNYDFEVEAIMHSEIKKEIIFLVALIGNIKNMKLSYSIVNIGNKYEPKNELVYNSNIIQHDSKAIFEQISLPLEKLSEDENLDDNLIQFNFYKKDNENNKEEVGKEKFSINQLFEKKDKELILNYNITAKILCQRKNFFNFLQYLYNNFHLITTFCIDFSSNNTVHKDNNKFENLLNNYLQLLVPYNSDKFFSCYAYGFKLNKTGESYINRIFPLSRKAEIISIEIDDIIPKYKKFLTKSTTSSTKNDLGLIIKEFNNNIKKNYDLEDKEYNLFIIFACYDIDDEQNIIDELIESCKLNISFIIIGIGKGSFRKIKNIINALKENGLKRDCVKFFKYDEMDEQFNNSLVNIPDVMIDFFCQNNILPNN